MTVNQHARGHALHLIEFRIPIGAVRIAIDGNYRISLPCAAYVRAEARCLLRICLPNFNEIAVRMTRKS